MDLDTYADGIADAPVAYHGVVFQNPLVVNSKSKASRILLGRDIIKGIGRAQVGVISENSRMLLEADDLIGNAAENAGYDAIIYPRDLQVIDTARLPEPESFTYDDECLPVAGDGTHLYEGIGFQRIAERFQAR